MEGLSFKKHYFPFIVATITILGFIVKLATKYQFPNLPWYPPHTWWVTEMLIGPVIVFIFAWQGWVFFIPLVVGIYYKSSYKLLFCLFVFVSISMGIAGTFFGFSHYSMRRFMIGIMTYSFIYGVIFFTVIIIKKLIEKAFK